MLSGFTALAKEGLAAAKELQEAAARELQEARSDGISGLERLKRNLQNAALLCQPAGAAGAAGATKSAGGGSTDWRKATPVAYTGPSIPTSNSLALVLLLFVMVIPLGFGIFRSRKKSDA
jgi:hypothetical protein